MTKIPMFNDFVIRINESKSKKNMIFTTRGPVRNKVLSFISEKGKVTEKELLEFFQSLEESIGKKPNLGWIKNNTRYVKKEISESGENAFTLTRHGKFVLKQRLQYEQKVKKYQDAKSLRNENV